MSETDAMSMMTTDVHPADERAFAAIAAVRPVTGGLVAAREAFAFPDRTLLHAGPPLAAHEVPAPIANSAAAAAVFEGWAHDRAHALASIATGEIALAPAQDHACVVPLASVLSPSQQVQVVRDARSHAPRAYAPLNGGSGPALRLGLPGPEVVEHLRWLNGPFADALRPAFERDIELLPIADRALVAGDDCHGRTQAATALLAQAIGSLPDDATQFIARSPSFFLNLWMAATKCMLSAATGIDDSSVVIAMGGNGVRAGIQLAGDAGRWRVMPALPPYGKLDPGWTDADRLPAIGDSAVIDAFGLGALAMTHAPAQQAALASYMPEPSTTLAEALLWGEHPAFVASHARFGLCARAVTRSNKTPVVALGILDRRGERGRIGGGIWRAPVELFEGAMAAQLAAANFRDRVS